MKTEHSGASGAIILAGLLLSSWLGTAFAQQPSAEQIAAIRQSCRSDFMSNCAGVQPGTKEALECLQRNAGKVSPACRSALDVIGTKPAADAVPPPAVTKPEPALVNAPPPPAELAPAVAVHKKPTHKQIDAVRAACRTDFGVHCPGVKPGSAAALQCLQVNAAALSPACRSAVAAIGEEGVLQPLAAPVAPAAAPPPAVAPLGPIPPMRPREALAILSFCRAEQQTLCADVPPGGGRIIACLAENAPRLSPACYTAIARAIR